MSDPQTPPGGLVAVGRITGVHGIRGEVAVLPLTDFPDRLEEGSVVLVEPPGGGAQPRRILSSRGHKGRLLILLEGVPDRSAAEALRGGWFRVREEDLRPLPAGHHYRHDLVGMAVVTEAGEGVGTVRELMEIGPERLILVVRGPRGEALLPFVEEFVPAIDAAARVITVRLPEGLLPGEAP